MCLQNLLFGSGHARNLSARSRKTHEVITRDTGQNEEAKEVEQEEAAEDMTERSNSYVPDAPAQQP